MERAGEFIASPPNSMKAMNDNRQLLANVNLDLHGPALELLDTMDARRIRVQVKVPENATPKRRAQSCSFTLIGATTTVEDPGSVLRTTLSDIVARYNVKRKFKLKATGDKLHFAPPKK